MLWGPSPPSRGRLRAGGAEMGTVMPGPCTSLLPAEGCFILSPPPPSHPSGVLSDRLCCRVTLGVLKDTCWKHKEASSVTCLVGRQSSPKNPAWWEENSASAIMRTSSLLLSAPAGMHSPEPKLLSGDGGSGATPSPLDSPAEAHTGAHENCTRAPA